MPERVLIFFSQPLERSADPRRVGKRAFVSDFLLFGLLQKCLQFFSEENLSFSILIVFLLKILK
jgi:hypothetical protein